MDEKMTIACRRPRTKVKGGILGSAEKAGRVGAVTYLDQSEVRNERLHLFDNLRLRRRIKGFELHIECCLFFRLLLQSSVSKSNVRLR
jgi:hypothetical protein